MAYVSHPILLLLFPLITISLPISLSQPLPNASCNGIFISYNYSSGFPIPPNLLPTNPTRQPYRFQSTLSILNNGLEELKSWRVRVVYGHGEYLVSAPGAVLADGTSLPADVSNGTVLAGETMPDLKSAAQTAGDWNQMQVRIELVGTQYGVGALDVPLPSSLSLANDGFSCPAPTKIGNNMLQLCCNKDSNFQSNTTSYTDFSPLRTGDLTIMYDVTKSYDSNYWAQVTISNNSPLARLDNWQLSWDWTRDEFIHSMKGAYPHIVDTTDCIYGRQGQYYKDLDFSTVLNCDRRPTIIDLPLTKTNDTNLGLIPFCCRDGVILPTFMDRSKSKSVFIMEVYKMPPDLNRTQLFSPQNFRINGTKMNPNYQCGPPARVSPTLFPDPSGLLSESTAVASWQVVCNLTKLEEPKCCVSFSAFFNDSGVPCNTCACGCKNQSMNTCNTTSSALLLPYEALLVPSENRTKMAKDFWKTKKWDLPNPLPCEDNCGVSINWHLLTDYRGGWTARMTIFNWGETNFADWFSAVELDKAMAGFEAVYSFNGTTNTDSKNTIFLQGLSGLNYLLAKRDSENPSKNPPVPGSAQSVISFTKKNTLGINVANGDGFPTKVYFNGEECSLPLKLPTGNGHKIGLATVFRTFIFIILMFL